MPALDFILPAATLVSRGDGGTAPPPTGDKSNGEPFDRVMTRALSPSESGESIGTDRPSASPTVPIKGKANAISSPPQRRRLQTRISAPENAAPADGEKGDPSMQTQNHQSHPPVSESDAGGNTGEVAAGSPARNENRAASGSLPGFTIQLVAALPAGTFPLFPSAAEMKIASDSEAIPASSLTTTPAATAGPDSNAALLPRTGAKTSSPVTATISDSKVFPDKVGAELISRLKPDVQQNDAVKAGGPAAGKAGPNDSQPAPLPANDLKASEFSATALPVLEFVSEPPVQLTQSETSSQTDLSAEAITSAQSGSNGTSVAKQYMPMKKLEKMNKVAGQTDKTEKVLPGSVNATGSEKNLPAAGPLARLSSRNEPAVIVFGPSTKGPEAAASAAAGASASAVVNLGSRALERTHDMIALHSMRLVDSKLDSLQVVIKPGAGLQLSLEIHQNGDAIDARVVLQRGNFGDLNQHWPELQQRLEQRGIRLAPLTGSENSATDPGANGFQRPPREFTNPDPFAASAFAEFALASSPIPSTAPSMAVAAALRGWETWA